MVLSDTQNQLKRLGNRMEEEGKPRLDSRIQGVAAISWRDREPGSYCNTGSVNISCQNTYYEIQTTQIGVSQRLK